MKTILLVHFGHELTAERIAEIEIALGDDELKFIEVHPSTAAEMHKMVIEMTPDMVVLREQPIPSLILDLVPVVPIPPMGQPLRRLVGIAPSFQDL